jgi:acyl dehydratase
MSVLTDIAVGATSSITYSKITRTDIVRYAGASGDFNKIHHDEPFAQSIGLPQVFSIGMFQAGLLSSFVTDWLGVEQIRKVTLRFKEQVWPEDELTCAGTVTSIENGRVVVDIVCTRQTGGVAIAGTAEFEISQ